MLETIRKQCPPSAAALWESIDRVEVFSIAMRVRFRGITVRDGVLLHGPAGWGECAPFWNHPDSHSAKWLASALSQATKPLADQGVPEPKRHQIPVNTTIAALGPEEAEARALAAVGAGIHTAKVKVADKPDCLSEDLQRLEAVRGAMGPGAALRIDVNAAWDLDQALKLLPLYDRAAGGLEYAEQPCRSTADLAVLRRKLQVPIAADESLRLDANPMAVRQLEAADVAVLKVAPLGGISAAYEIYKRLEMPAVVSSALDTSVGIYAGLRLAGTLDELPYACGLATGSLLQEDVIEAPFRPVNGHLTLSQPVSVKRVPAASEPLRERWCQRLVCLSTLLAS